MRAITRDSVSAFLRGDYFSRGNMTVIDGNLYLHGNLIAQRFGESIMLCDAHWQSNTTKERLNGIFELLRLRVRIVQRDWSWYISGEDWHGEVLIVIERGIVQRIESVRPNGDTINIPLEGW